MRGYVVTDKMGGARGGIDRVGTIFALYFMCNRDFSLIMRKLCCTNQANDLQEWLRCESQHSQVLYREFLNHFSKGLF